MIFFSEEIMSLDFIGLLSFIQIPIQFIIGDLGYTFNNKIGNFFDEKFNIKTFIRYFLAPWRHDNRYNALNLF
jgi:hypothetical protein